MFGFVCLDDLKGQVIWITGASTGIGASCAIEAAKLGAKLVLSARNETLLKEIKQKCLGKYHTNSQVCIKFDAVGPLSIYVLTVIYSLSKNE